MDEVRGKLEVMMLFGKGQKPSLHEAATACAKVLQDLCITHDGRTSNTKSTWGVIKFTVTGVAGVTIVPTTLSVAMSPAPDPHPGTLKIQVQQHPAGPVAAALMTGHMGEWLAKSLDFSIGEGGFVRQEKYAQAVAHLPVFGAGVWYERFREVSAIFTPEG